MAVPRFTKRSQAVHMKHMFNQVRSVFRTGERGHNFRGTAETPASGQALKHASIVAAAALAAAAGEPVRVQEHCAPCFFAVPAGPVVQGERLCHHLAADPTDGNDTRIANRRNPHLMKASAGGAEEAAASGFRDHPE